LSEFNENEHIHAFDGNNLFGVCFYRRGVCLQKLKSEAFEKSHEPP